MHLDIIQILAVAPFLVALIDWAWWRCGKARKHKK